MHCLSLGTGRALYLSCVYESVQSNQIPILAPFGDAPPQGRGDAACKELPLPLYETISYFLISFQVVLLDLTRCKLLQLNSSISLDYSGLIAWC